ncbi:MAG: hypothetical protein AAFN11_11815 [Chloroflexota bacterium]
MSDKTNFLGLTPAETDNLLQALRYGAIIVLTVLVTFTIVAGISGIFGYTPPTPPDSLPTAIPAG